MMRVLPWRHSVAETRQAYADKDRAEELLQAALDDPDAGFRPSQWEAIEHVVADRARLLVVQRTGWGKSLVYFLATRLLRDAGAGPTLLISPLLALMRNQVLAAQRLGIRAATINSSNRQDWHDVQERLLRNEIDILLISPERLSNDEFREDVLVPAARTIGLFVVDEAHCISDWGHDFRPDYRRITRVLQLLPGNVPMLATTATANNRVVEDVLATLGSNVRLLRGPLGRESLQLQAIFMPRQAMRMAWLAERLPSMPGSGIVYALTIRDTQRLAAFLRAQGINAHAYWGGQESDERERLEEALLENRIKALVATTALGMGFDKPDLGFVIHFQRPGSVVHYYQQVGRAGRALPDAYGVLLAGGEDREIVDYFIRTAFPPDAHVDEVLKALGDADEGLSLPQLEASVNLSRTQLEKVLKSLAAQSPAPVGKQGTRWVRNPVRYKVDRAKVERLTRIRYEEQARMDRYMASQECLMLFLERELDDPDPQPCGRCSWCVGRPLLPTEVSPAMVERAVQFLRRNDQIIAPRRQWPAGALSTHGWTGRIAPDLQNEQGRALSMWGDDGWGELVRRGKQIDGRFDDALVSASASLIRARWKPRPAPAWVTCVPSLNHPDLVPSFARRLANELRLPFVPCIKKMRQTEPQKRMENSYQQAANLRLAFQVQRWRGMEAPVLLVDDMVDSGWTLTVVGALLRQVGSGPVYPFALAVTTAQ